MGIANIAQTMRGIIPRIIFDLEPKKFAIEAPQGNVLRNGEAIHVEAEGQEPLRLFHVIPQPDPRPGDFNGEQSEYKQTVEVQMRYHIPLRPDALPEDLDGVTRAAILAAEDASNISHFFEADFGWGEAAELTFIKQLSTSKIQPLGGDRYFFAIEFEVDYTRLTRPRLIP